MKESNRGSLLLAVHNSTYDETAMSLAEIMQAEDHVEAMVAFKPTLVGSSDLSSPVGNLSARPSQTPCSKRSGAKSPVSTSPSKADDKPRRPLTSYNIFFKEQRRMILSEMPTRPEGKPRRSHGKIGFAELARLIASRWKAVDKDTRKYFDDLAAKDKVRYQNEMAVWKKKEKQREQQQRLQPPAASTQPVPAVSSSSSFAPQNGMGLNVTAPRRLADFQGRASEWVPSMTSSETSSDAAFVGPQREHSISSPLAHSGPIHPDSGWSAGSAPEEFQNRYADSAEQTFERMDFPVDRRSILQLADDMDRDSLDYFINMFQGP